MKTMNQSALAVFAIIGAPALVMGFETPNRNAGRETGDTSKSTGAARSHKEDATNKETKGRYAAVNGLNMYYETHGTGRPLVLLHGGLTTIDTSFATILPSLAKTRQVIAIELQGHGHTADIDRPLSFEQMADDAASLLRQLKIERADFFGYSLGGIVGLGIAIRHPNLVNKLIVLGTNYNSGGFKPEIREAMKNSDPAGVPKELKAAYESSAPDPTHWPVLVANVKKLLVDFQGWRPEDMRLIDAPILVMIGDNDFGL